jgi:CheY-like chemotaxis protein/HPt (histidine-containing phosphotransfer) domain-containing protein
MPPRGGKLKPWTFALRTAGNRYKKIYSVLFFAASNHLDQGCRLLDTLLPTMASQSKPLRILIIDDDPMSRELLAVLLEGEGYAVTSAESGESALTLLAEENAPHDLVLADMNMPGTTGTDLACELRRACDESTLLLAISASQPAEEAISQFDGFLLKPFRMDEIAVALAARNRSAHIVPAATKKAARNAASDGSSSSISIYASTPETASNSHMQTQVQELESPSVLDDLAAGPVLNEKIYQQLAVSIPTPQLHEMYTLCVNDARERIAVMRSLLTTNDETRFIREAHTIKGSCGMLGATQLHGMAAELERRGLESSAAQDQREVNSLDELSAACDRLERMLGSRV